MEEVFSNLATNVIIARCLPKEGRYGDRVGWEVFDAGALRCQRLLLHVSNPAPKGAKRTARSSGVGCLARQVLAGESDGGRNGHRGY